VPAPCFSMDRNFGFAFLFDCGWWRVRGSDHTPGFSVTPKCTSFILPGFGIIATSLRPSAASLFRGLSSNGLGRSSQLVPRLRCLGTTTCTRWPIPEPTSLFSCWRQCYRRAQLAVKVFSWIAKNHVRARIGPEFKTPMLWAYRVPIPFHRWR